MSVTIRDVESATVLRQTVGMEVEMFGPDGQLLGWFTPAPRPGISYPELGVTDEELEREIRDPNVKWYTGEEVMARLHQIDEAG